MPINALEFHESPQRVVAPHLPVVAAGCSPNVTFSTISAPVGQKCFIFPMDFNNSYLRQISSILDRCARIMFSMVWRTCRFCAFKNDTYFQRISTISLYHDLWPSKILFPPMVLATFSSLHQLYIIFRNHDRGSFCCCFKLCIYFQRIFNIFILLLLHVIFAPF